ncbi:unnamed protein product [Arctogadus glacialis]
MCIVYVGKQTPTSKLEKGFRLYASTYIHSYEALIHQPRDEKRKLIYGLEQLSERKRKKPQSPPFYLYCDLCHYATVALPDGVVTNPWHSADRVVF